MVTRFRHLTALALTGLLAACTAPVQPMDDDALIARIESRIEMPPGAGPLSEYNRRYSRRGQVFGANEANKVTGLLLRSQDLPRDAAMVDSLLDVVMDGGCDVIQLTYDEAADRIESIACNGEA